MSLNNSLGPIEGKYYFNGGNGNNGHQDENNDNVIDVELSHQ